MIELSPTTALMVYLGTTLACLLGLWITSHYRYKKKNFLPFEKEFHVCEFCHFAYLETGSRKITRCPQCQSFNKRKKKREGQE